MPWAPWRYTAADYRAALTAHPHTGPLAGSAAETPWDPGLAAELGRAGRRIEEEPVLTALLDDLGPLAR